MVFPDSPPYTGGDYLLSIDGAVSWTDDSTNSVYFKEYGDVIVAPRDIFMSGYVTRFYKTQVVGYHAGSGDLRSVEVNASGSLKTDFDGSVSGDHVVVNGVQVSGTVAVSGAVSISGNIVSISGNLIGDRGSTQMRTGNVVVVTGASGGQSLAVSGQWCSGEVHTVRVKNFSGNLDVYIGGSGCVPYSGYGYPISTGENITIDMSDIQLVYLCASKSGEFVGFMGTAY